MTRIPFLRWTPAGTPGGHINPRMVILHSDCANGSEPHPHDGLEWHAHVNYDGTGEQLVDTDLRADANYMANAFAISVETSSNVAATDPWTPAELKTIALICIWAHQTYGIPLQPCASWDGPGIGYHTMWGSPSHWTPVAKSCPGPARIQQFQHDLFPLIQSLLNPPKENPDMAVAWHLPHDPANPESDRSWCVSAAGRWPIASPAVLGALQFAGIITGAPVEVPAEVLNPIPVIGAPVVLPPSSGTCQYIKPTTAVISMNTPPSTGTISFN